MRNPLKPFIMCFYSASPSLRFRGLICGLWCKRGVIYSGETICLRWFRVHHWLCPNSFPYFGSPSSSCQWPSTEFAVFLVVLRRLSIHQTKRRSMSMYFLLQLARIADVSKNPAIQDLWHAFDLRKKRQSWIPRISLGPFDCPLGGSELCIEGCCRCATEFFVDKESVARRQ